jgi:transcriptional regulator with XRE-family HTH domain
MDASDYCKTLGARLKAIRQDGLRLTRDEVAARSGGRITAGMLRWWEMGLRRTRAEQLAELGAVYGVAPADLVPR